MRDMIVYVTGGIGSGKSTAVQILADFGAHVERADAIVHELLGRSEVRQEIADRLDIPVDADRAAIATIVFADAEKLRTLESILHPKVRTEVGARVARLSPGEPLVYEIPLLPSPAEGDVVVVIDASDDLRFERLVARGMTPADARRRMSLQPAREEYQDCADVVVANTGSEAELRDALRAVWEGVQHGTGAV
jgi:dephospho-CoA kinase